MHKPKILTFLLLIFLSIPSFAQLSIGIKGGYSRVWEDYGDTEIPENAVVHLNRFNASIFVYKKLNKFLSLGVEPGYAQRGAACVPGTVFFTDDLSLYVDYISLPLFLSGEIGLFEDKINVFLKTGYGVSGLVSAKVEELIPDGSGSFISRKARFGGIVNNFDTGVYGGFGIDVNFGKGQIRVESEYYYSFRNAISSLPSKNRSLSLNLGYCFQL